MTSTPIDDSSIPSPRRKLWIKIGKILAGIAAIGLLIFGGLALLFWVAVLRPFDEVTITVTNNTKSEIESAGIFNSATDIEAIVKIGPLTPGETASASTHFGKDYGTCPFVIKQAGIRRSDTIGCLLDDNGPFTYDIAVDAAGVHVKCDIASKGSASFDLTLTMVP